MFPAKSLVCGLAAPAQTKNNTIFSVARVVCNANCMKKLFTDSFEQLL